MRHDGDTNNHQRKKEKTMKKITTIGLDLAKNVFHMIGCNEYGKVLRKKMLRRREVIPFFTQMSPCLIGMETCSGAHYWAHQLTALGHQVKLIPAQYVKPFVQGNKNDYNDALAIAEVRFVTPKTTAQQDVQALHRLRERRLQERTALCNQVRGLLAEYGVIMPKGVNVIRRQIPELLEDGENNLSGLFRQLLAQCYQQLQEIDQHIERYTRLLKEQNKQDEACQRLQTIPGFGPIVASVFHAVVGDGSAFRRGRDVSASLGLVPRQHSSGGKDVLLGISKRGDGYLRSLLVHGARSVVQRARGKDDRLSRWINKLRDERGYNKAAVALANKLARIGWVILSQQSTYHSAR